MGFYGRDGIYLERRKLYTYSINSRFSESSSTKLKEIEILKKIGDSSLVVIDFGDQC